MSPPPGEIRAYKTEDEKPVKFMIGKAKMEGLATANVKAVVNPITISVWLGFAAAFIEYNKWWPKPGMGVYAWLSPIPALAATLVPIIALVDWLNRPDFEDLVQEALHGPDIPDLLAHYARSPASGLWVLDFNKDPVGIVAIDASMDSEVASFSDSKSKAKGTSETAVIRHFYVDEQYRKVDIQKDLLQHALQRTFSAKDTVKRVKVSCSTLTSYLQKCLKEEGFTVEEKEKSRGIFRWKTNVWVLERERYDSRLKK